MTIAPAAPAASSLGGISIRSTRNLIDADTKICMLIYAPAKRGKTLFGKTLDDLTKKHFGKPALFIAMEPSDGGGTMSLKDFDVDFVMPQTMAQLNSVIAALASDTKYGAVVFDSATEYVNRFLKPYSISFPFTKGAAPPTRKAGVPDQSDYQTMGEQLRMDFNLLLNLTVNPNLNIRKHLLVTALEREKYTRDGKELVAIQPDLPGAMSAVATSMFQTVGCIELNARVVPDPAKPGQNTRVVNRTLLTESSPENKRVIGDRTGLILNGSPLDFVQIYESVWLPKIKSMAVA